MVTSITSLKYFTKNSYINEIPYLQFNIDEDSSDLAYCSVK